MSYLIYIYNITFIKDISENPLWKEQIRSRIALREINLKVWLETNLFSPVWWLMIGLFILFWFTWWKLLDKKRLLEIVAFGLMISLYSTVFDVIAAQLVLWGFPNRLTPVSPPIVFEDLCVLPIIFMLIYQYFTSWKSFFIVLIITAGILAFIIEPIAVWLDIFQLHNWKYSYSFLLYIFMASFLKWVMNNLKSKQK